MTTTTLRSPKEIALAFTSAADLRALLIRRAAETLLSNDSLATIPAQTVKEIVALCNQRDLSYGVSALSKAQATRRIERLVKAYGGDSAAAERIVAEALAPVIQEGINKGQIVLPPEYGISNEGGAAISR